MKSSLISFSRNLSSYRLFWRAGILLALSLCTAGPVLYPRDLQADLVGSAHDFSTTPWGGGGCYGCHGAHPKDPTVAVMWNHELSAATYTLYGSPTLNATMTQPIGRTRLCLGCHDGTVALENYGGFTGGTTFMGGPTYTGKASANLGTNLSDDHPVACLYDSALAAADGKLKDPGAANALDPLRLYSGVVECSTCHDVHNQGGATAGLLRMSNSGSAMCLICHLK